MRALPFDSIGIYIAQALPGSELFEIALASGKISKESARTIDTARTSIPSDELPRERLEKLVSDFLLEYNLEIRTRDPSRWFAKYGQHLDRLGTICVGSPAANTAGIMAANAGSNSKLFET